MADSAQRRRQHQPSERERWLQYEREKRRLQEKNLSSEEYDRAIRRLCDALNI